jgi:hypothetical protein
MAREKKATGDAPKKRTSRKTPVAAAEQITQQSRDNGNVQRAQASQAGNNGANTAERGSGTGDDVIRRRAYEIWEQRGRQHGKDADDWFRAESEVRGKSA